MRLLIRQLWDKFFTGSAVVSILLMVLALVLILGPMLVRGGSAVFFRGTVEFRKMQLALYNRGDVDEITTESAEVEKSRQVIFDTLNHFRRGIETEHLIKRARKFYRDYGDQLRQQNTPSEQYTLLRSQAKKIRNKLCDAYESENKNQVLENLDFVIQQQDNSDFKGTLLEELFVLAQKYKKVVQSIDLTRREQYAQSLNEVQEILRQLFGPLPGEPTPSLALFQYGATRWDLAQKYLHRLLWKEEWIQIAPDKPLVRRELERKTLFAGTELESIFDEVQNNLPVMLQPHPTFYWQYFIDDHPPGYYFGGVGPEIIGTLLITLISMLVAIPLGIISAAYLIECAGENIIVRVIRTCINTLAGVPSIVFGLFGLAFFVLYVLPRFHMASKECILTASLTLALLVLPVIIRASEEAIRSVPRTYKEASLALGAGRFRTFVTVTLPAAAPGILTGIILSVSRAAGETAPILFTGAVAFAEVPRSLLQQTPALSIGSYVIATSDNVGMNLPHKQYGMVMTLIVLILCLNIFAIWIRSRTSKKLHGY